MSLPESLVELFKRVGAGRVDGLGEIIEVGRAWFFGTGSKHISQLLLVVILGLAEWKGPAP